MEETLTAEEARVLGVLIEKELATPEYYPMTVNAIVTGANQKTNRDPVVAYGEDEVRDALESLQRKRLVGNAGGSYARVAKFRHALAEAMALNEAQRAVLGVLLLRGAQTVGELRSRTNRLHAFDTLEDVEQVLTQLASRETPLAAEVPRRPGQKEVRYVQLMTGAPDEPGDEQDGAEGGAAERSLRDRVESLERQLEELQTAFASFRRQFE